MKISSLDSAHELGVSHNARIRKRVLVASGEIEPLITFSQAIFPPGETANAHRHEDMTEVFFVEAGDGRMYVDGEPLLMKPGVCVTVEPGEIHEITNTGAVDMVVTYFGVRTPSRDSSEC